MARMAAVLAVALGLAACGGSRMPVTDAADDVQPDAEDVAIAAVADVPANGATAGCLDGVWTAQQAGRTLSFTFHADHTGEEVPGPARLRPFLWRQMAADRVRLCYPEEGDDELHSEVQLDVDCAAGELRHQGIVYTKRD